MVDINCVFDPSCLVIRPLEKRFFDTMIFFPAKPQVATGKTVAFLTNPPKFYALDLLCSVCDFVHFLLPQATTVGEVLSVNW